MTNPNIFMKNKTLKLLMKDLKKIPFILDSGMTGSPLPDFTKNAIILGFEL